MMTRLHATFLVLLVFGSEPILAYANDTLTSKLNQQLKRLNLSENEVGIEIAQMENGKSIFSRQPTLGLNPASSLKILVAATALSKLGPNHRFVTTLARSGKNICLIGGGDPSLVYEQLLPFASELIRSGVKMVEGDLIVDESLFPISRETLEEFGGDRDRAFTAPIAPLSLDFNSLTIEVIPAEVGKPPRVGLEPNLDIFQVQNHAQTVATSGPKDIGASVKETNGKFVVEVFGKIGKNIPKRALYRSVSNPGLYAATAFIDRFVKEGGAFQGKVRFEACKGEPVVQFESRPLSQIVLDMNKFSNNFIADMLLRAIGSGNSPQKGIETIRAYLTEIGIVAKELLMMNASGLSEESRVSPRTLVDVILHASKDLTIGPEFVSSLGISGTDGTLKRRFKGTSGEGVIRAKSGMIKGVVSLTGVAATRHYGDIVFSMIFNTSKVDPSRLMKAEEEMLLTIIAN